MGEREPARALREGDPGRGVQPLAEQLALVSASRLALQAVDGVFGMFLALQPPILASYIDFAVCCLQNHLLPVAGFSNLENRQRSATSCKASFANFVCVKSNVVVFCTDM